MIRAAIRCADLVAALGAGVLATGAAATDFETGLRAYEAGDYAVALEAWAPLAAMGDAEAAFGLGQIFEHGSGVERNVEAAEVWYARAAEAGHAAAAYNLGNLLRSRDGPRFDPVAGAEWWRKAAEAGLTVAQVNLGIAYQWGDGVAQSATEAFAWYRRAAEAGHPTGAMLLGQAYEAGIGTPVDLAAAASWYERAAAAGQPGAAERLAALRPAPAPAAQPVPAPPAQAEPAGSPEPMAEPVAAEVEPAPQMAPAVAPAQAAATDAVSATSGIYVQLAAFLDQPRAERAWREFEARFPDLFSGVAYRIERAEKADGTVVYRVQVGPYARAESAKALCTALTERGADCLVTR